MGLPLGQAAGNESSARVFQARHRFEQALLGHDRILVLSDKILGVETGRSSSPRTSAVSSS